MIQALIKSSTQEAEAGRNEASLVYKVSSEAVRATEEPRFKNKQTNL